MADELIVDLGSTYEYFEHVLSLGRDKDGKLIDVANFDRDPTGIKTKHQLYLETQEENVRVMVNPETGRFERRSVSNRFFVYELRRQILWHEIARCYPNGKVSTKKKDHTASETFKKGEEDPETVCERWKRQEWRKLGEKIGYMPETIDLIPHLDDRIGRGNWKDQKEKLQVGFDPHESTVFASTLSVVEYYSYDLLLDFYNPAHTLGTGFAFIKDYDEKKEGGHEWVEICLAPFNYPVKTDAP